jgi:hypothetical protein
VLNHLENRTSVEWGAAGASASEGASGTAAGVVVNPWKLRFLLDGAPLRAARSAAPRVTEIHLDRFETEFLAFVARGGGGARSAPIILTTGHDYLHWWKQHKVQLNGVGRLNNAIFVAQVEHECVPLWQMDIVCLVDTLTGAIASPNPMYGRPVIAKWFYIEKLVSLGHDVLFLDSDVALLRDPFLLLRSHDQGRSQWRSPASVLGLSDYLHDIPCQGDSCHPLGTCHNHKTTCQSTGVMFFRTTAKAILATMTKQLRGEPELWEQEMWNRVLSDWPDRATRHRYFDSFQVANCRVFRELSLRDGLAATKSRLIVLHLGYVQSWMKQSMLEKYGVWGKPGPLLPNATEHPHTLCAPDGIWSSL